MSNVRRWAGPATSVAVLAIVIWRIGTGPFVAGFESVDGRALLAAAAIGFVTTVCGAWRWTIVARGLGLRISLPAAVAAYYRALFLNLTLPTGIAGDVHRGVSHGREVQHVGRGLRAVVWERGAGQVVQAVLMISLLLVLPSPVRSSMPFVALAAVGLAARSRPRVAGCRLGGADSRWMRLRNAVVADLRNGVLRRNALPAIVLASTVAVLGYALMFLVAARTVGVTAPISRLLPVALLATLAMVLPSIAGWGPREGAAVWVFSAAGLGAAAWRRDRRRVRRPGASPRSFPARSCSSSDGFRAGGSRGPAAKPAVSPAERSRGCVSVPTRCSPAASRSTATSATPPRACFLSNDADFDRVDAVRASCDAILVGAETVRVDNPRLLVRSQTRRDERCGARPAGVADQGHGDAEGGARRARRLLPDRRRREARLLRERRGWRMRASAWGRSRPSSTAAATAWRCARSAPTWPSGASSVSWSRAAAPSTRSSSPRTSWTSCS